MSFSVKLARVIQGIERRIDCNVVLLGRSRLPKSGMSTGAIESRLEKLRAVLADLRKIENRSSVWLQPSDQKNLDAIVKASKSIT